MAKYEIMLIVSGSLEEKKAKTIASEIASSIKETKPTVEEYGSKELAYKIQKDTHGYYFQYNFETDKPQLVNEFRRLCGINKNVLRHLIINLEKDYGYKATVNPKKVERNQKRAEVYAKRKSEYEKMKEARQAEYLARKEEGSDEFKSHHDGDHYDDSDNENSSAKKITKSTRSKSSDEGSSSDEASTKGTTKKSSSTTKKTSTKKVSKK